MVGRPKYMSLYADEETQKVFDEFVKIKGIKKTEALSEMLRMYMLSHDERLYVELEKKYWGISDMSKQERSDTEGTRSSNDYIFIKLNIGTSLDGEKMDGHRVIKAYQENATANGRGYTWFSTDSLRYGMEKEKADEYNRRIQSGEKVMMLFAVADEQNDICYTAEVMEVQTSKNQMYCPDDVSCVPVEFGEKEYARVWIKIKDIKGENRLKADMFKIISTGKNLKEAISTRFHFGYVCLDEDALTETGIQF
ncbi:MAG: hypothetical protein IJG65_08010 [Synergistaceae bacterium]|nr:hypothetical protein [Synergistaceae bacterium]